MICMSYARFIIQVDVEVDSKMKEFPEGILIYPACGPGKNRQSGILVACTEAKKYI